MEIKEYQKIIEKLTQEIVSLKKQIEELKNNKKTTGGRIPFGYKCPDGINLVEDEEQQHIISIMRKMREHHTSYREIAKKINEQYNIHLSHTGVMRIINRNPEPQTKFVF